MKKNLLLLIILLTLTSTCKKNPEFEIPKENAFIAPKKNYLSKDWVSYKQAIVKGENTSNSTWNQLRSKANAKMQKGIQFYKIKKDLDAVREYEEAIEYYPFANLYYHYGNSLANLNRLEDSILAYEISLSICDWQYKDEVSRPELAMYNIACSYSKLNQLDEAYTYLAQAVDRGYNAFAYVEKDLDMENLRKQPDWKNKVQKWRQEYNYDENTVAGLVKNSQPRVSSLYFLCKNGVMITLDKDYCPTNENGTLGYYKGTWELVNGDIKINIQESCLPTYEISKKEKEIYDSKMQGAAYYCPPGIPRFDGICKVDEKFRSRFYSPLIGREVVKEMVKKSLQKKEQDNSLYEFSLRKLKENQEPKQCDPDFIPTTIEDITIRVE